MYANNNRILRFLSMASLVPFRLLSLLVLINLCSKKQQRRQVVTEKWSGNPTSRLNSSFPGPKAICLFSNLCVSRAHQTYVWLNGVVGLYIVMSVPLQVRETGLENKRPFQFKAVGDREQCRIQKFTQEVAFVNNVFILHVKIIEAQYGVPKIRLPSFPFRILKAKV